MGRESFGKYQIFFLIICLFSSIFLFPNIYTGLTPFRRADINRVQINEHYMNKNNKDRKENTGQTRYTKKNYKIINGPRNLFELR